jgi:hypothetical protein
MQNPNARPLNKAPLHEKYGDLPLPLRDALRDFVDSHDSLVRMDTAVRLGRTPAEALTDGILTLIAEHRVPLHQIDRTKMCVGHLVRRILEGYGYVHRATGKKTFDRRLFHNASTYDLPHGM